MDSYSKEILDEILNEIGDMHSSKLQYYFESIGPLLLKVESLEAILDDIWTEKENATVQLVNELPEEGHSGVFYIKNDGAYYIEYQWDGSDYVQVGTLGDDPTDMPK